MTTVTDMLRKTTSHDPDRVAVRVDGIGDMTYAQWDQASNRLGRLLVARGVGPGDRVGLMFDRDEALDYLRSYMGVHKAGGVAVPLDPRLPAAELRRALDHCAASALLTGQPAAEARCGFELGADELRQGFVDGDAAAFQVARSGDDIADLLYTSGTTGHPKAVVCTHDSVTFKGDSRLHAIFRSATFLHAIPLFTFAGTHAMTLIPLRGGMTSIIQPRFEPGRFLELLASAPVNLAYAVPSMLLLMLNHARVERGGFDELRLLMYGTAPMPPAAISRLAEVFRKTMLVNLYGLTEGGAAVCSLPPHEASKRPGSVGKPLPPTEVRIVADDGTDVPVGHSGEILLRADGVQPRSYYNDSAATTKAWTADGWLHTGDIGRLDEDGFLYIVDRIKDLIIRGGFNISAPQVEAAMVSHPRVLDAAVIGVPHEVLGEDIKAFVVLVEGEVLDADSLRHHCAAELADYKVPRDIAFVDDLPRNALGKVLKRQLRQEGCT